MFYFATNYHTLAGATKNVRIVFESRDDNDLLPQASTCGCGVISYESIAQYLNANALCFAIQLGPQAS